MNPGYCVHVANIVIGVKIDNKGEAVLLPLYCV